MQKQVWKALGKIMFFIALLFVGGFLDVLGRDWKVGTVTTAYYLLLSVVFAGRLSERVADERIRKYLTATAWMMIFFFLLRGMKYHAFRELDGASRFLWYLYYVPILSVPYLSLLAALSVDEAKKRRLPWPAFALGGVTVLLGIMILTNDLTQAVFRFQPGFVQWDSDYDYGMVYFFVLAWGLIVFGSAVTILVRKCRLTAAKGMIGISLLPIALGLTYDVFYVIGMPPKWKGVNFIEFPEVLCFVVACFWECCITIGLIPSNKGYETIFMQSKVAAQITDDAGVLAYASKSAKKLTKEQRQMPEDAMLDENTYLHRRPIHGGLVYWQSDVTKIRELNQKLQEIEDSLSEEAQLIRLKNEMQKEGAKIEEKNALYDRIAAQTYRQSQRIAELAQEAEEKNTLYERNVKLICLYGTYIKRYSNLMLLAEGSGEISARELELAIAESLHALHFLGKPVSTVGRLQGMVPSGEALGIYESFEELLEASVEELRGIMITYCESRDGQECKLVLEGWRGRLPEKTPGDASAEGNAWPRIGKWQAEEDVLYVSYPLGKGGERSDVP